MKGTEDDGPRIVTVLGTARPGNYTAKALALARIFHEAVGLP